FRAMSQLTQRYRLIFMPGMLIGQNVAIGDKLLEQQSQLCNSYAKHLRDTPGLLYYINGDYQMRLDEHPQDIRVLWNRWLKDKYGTTEKIRSAWGVSALAGELGNLDFWPPNSGKWNDVAMVDKLSFQNWLTRRWNQAHVAAVRGEDSEHPITSEYYQICWGGLDLIQTIDGQDVSNIGFFDKPGDDIRGLPLKIRFNDLRARGKGVSLGEYGVKTHPAWTVENGAEFYHIRRTEEQQIQLFLSVAHYALGMGLSKIQNWCLRDSQTSVFPWGIFYPNQLIPKDVAYIHRNQSVIWRHFTPRYVTPPLAVCIPNNLRMGNDEAMGRTVADQVFETLLTLHYDFNVIDDHHLDVLTDKTKVMLYPSPFAVRDDAYSCLLEWVRQGGTLIVTGDISYDENRQRNRIQRLSELAGVELLGDNYPNINRAQLAEVKVDFTLASLPPLPVRPCISVRPLNARVLGWTDDGNPVLLRHVLGKGRVYLFTDPIELTADPKDLETRQSLYQALLRTTSVKPLPVIPDEPWLHVMAQPTKSGIVHVIFNRRQTPGQEEVHLPTAAGQITLNTRNYYPALAVVTDDGRVVAVSACGTAGVDQHPLMNGEGLKAMLSLDGLDLRQSRAFLMAPFEAGRFEVCNPTGTLSVLIGEFQDGRWLTLDRRKIDKQSCPVDVDPDLATCLMLFCSPADESKWIDSLTTSLIHPDRINGY
ncbi:MAG: beta-galactosidase, partial [Planctomycetota bacterium]